MIIFARCLSLYLNCVLKGVVFDFTVQWMAKSDIIRSISPLQYLAYSPM